MLSVIIPVYNEDKTIEKLLDLVFSTPPIKEVIIVNDGSSDRTKEIIRKIDQSLHSRIDKYPNLIRLKIINKKNKGKGSAIREGFKVAKGEILLIQDADLELDPKEYPILLSPFETMNADIVFGSRYLNKTSIKNLFYYGNKVLTKISNVFTGIKMTDINTCYKVFKRDVIKSIIIKSNGFCIDPELAAFTAKAIKSGKKYFEVPISYYPRSKAMGKKISYLDGFKSILCIIRYNLFS